MWTMEELVERLRAALAPRTYPGAPNGGVRDLRDRRAIRWYATIGLVDRPLGMRGRNALYGPRHLLQLVAIKRRQAAGRTLAEIQAELTGASDEALAAAAEVPPDLLLTDGPAPDPGPERSRFWGAAPGPSAPVPAADWAFPATAAHAAAPPMHSTEALLTGVPLGSGVILLIPAPISDRDRDDLAVAARPLLDLLAARGLTNGRN